MRKSPPHKFVNGVECKFCIKCEKWVSLDGFYSRKGNWDGLRADCKSCFSILGKARYERDWEIIQLRSKQYYNKNKEKVNSYKSQWQRDNKERRRIRLNERYRSEPNFRIAVNLRTRLLKALENNQKKGSTLDLLGCSVESFRKYLESMFVDGMSWNNHGDVWHIDHIRPCASFDLSKEDEQRICFHYSNMQPLFVQDNLSKGCRYE